MFKSGTTLVYAIVYPVTDCCCIWTDLQHAWPALIKQWLCPVLDILLQNSESEQAKVRGTVTSAVVVATMLKLSAASRSYPYTHASWHVLLLAW